MGKKLMCLVGSIYRPKYGLIIKILKFDNLFNPFIFLWLIVN